MNQMYCFPSDSSCICVAKLLLGCELFVSGLLIVSCNFLSAILAFMSFAFSFYLCYLKKGNVLVTTFYLNVPVHSPAFKPIRYTSYIFAYIKERIQKKTI